MKEQKEQSITDNQAQSEMSPAALVHRASIGYTAGQVKDLTGQTFGKCLVIKRSGVSKRGVTLWLCLCECGREVIKRSDNLRGGQTRCNKCAKTNGEFKPTKKKSGLPKIKRRCERCGEPAVPNASTVDYKDLCRQCFLDV